jgi:hypothetical protein
MKDKERKEEKNYECTTEYPQEVEDKMISMTENK